MPHAWKAESVESYRFPLMAKETIRPFSRHKSSFSNNLEYVFLYVILKDENIFMWHDTKLCWLDAQLWEIKCCLLYVCVFYALFGAMMRCSQRKKGMGKDPNSKEHTSPHAFFSASQRYPGLTSLYVKLSIKVGVLGVEMPLGMDSVQAKLPLRRAAWQMELSVILNSSVCCIVKEMGGWARRAALSDWIELKVVTNSSAVPQSMKRYRYRLQSLKWPVSKI